MRPTRVLCLDGGGIRGLLPARLVAEIETRTGKPASELFDLIAGTSTGGLIAMALAAPDQDGRPAYSGWDCVHFYLEEGPRIFTRLGLERVSALGGLVHERYHTIGLTQLLVEHFGDLRLSDALCDVLVTAYEIVRRETFLFSSREARLGADRDFLMRDAIRSTTAAPTYFDPSLLFGADGRRHVLIDGGVFANSPAMCAFAEVEREQLSRDVLIASVGAGSLTTTFEYDEVCSWGVAHWARPLLEIVLDGAAQTSEHVLGRLLGPDRFFRFQQTLLEASDRLDDVSPGNLAALSREADAMVARCSARIDELCAQLVG